MDVFFWTCSSCIIWPKHRLQRSHGGEMQMTDMSLSLCPYNYAQADVCIRVHRLVPPFDPGPQSFLLRPHWAANWIRRTENIDNRRDATPGTELPLNPFFTLCLSASPTSSLASNSHQKGEDVSKQCRPVLAAAGKTQRHNPRLWNQILRKGWCRIHHS